MNSVRLLGLISLEVCLEKGNYITGLDWWGNWGFTMVYGAMDVTGI
jgi:hypothetical protein